MRFRLFVALAAGIIAAGTSPSADDADQKHVLVLHMLSRDSPLSIGMEDVYRRILGDELGPRLDYYSEFLDVTRFGDPQYQSTLRAFLRDRYGSRHLDLVIAPSTAALTIVRGGRDDLFKGVPVVFHAGKGVTVEAPATGVVSEVDLAASLELALDLHPSTKHVAVVGGSSDTDRAFSELARSQFKRFEDRATFSYLFALPIADVEQAVSRMPADSLIYYVALSQDGSGKRLLAVEALTRLSAAANVPVYGWHDDMVGHGIVGGRLFSSRDVASQTANLAVRVLRGEAPESIAVADIHPYVTRFDWRQLQRWSIADSRLPAGSVVSFRPVSVWDHYRRHIVLALVVLAVLAALGGALGLEHRRRQRAEMEARRYLATMADLDRRASMGHLTASLAHELRQPLGAILRNSEAARLILKSSTPNLAELREIVDDIRNDDKRAADIIKGVKALLLKHDRQEESVDLGEVARETIDFVGPDARVRGVRLQVDLPKAAVVVTGDRVHLQQVLLNLVLNGMDAMAHTAPDQRLLVVAAAANNGHIDLSVRDRGTGVREQELERIFDPFFSTKTDGMGMGLSIARSIVEAHHGQISAENNSYGGATVRVTLPSRRKGQRSDDQSIRA